MPSKDRIHANKLLTADQTPGAAFPAKFRQAITEHVTNVIANATSDPIVLWGESAMRWYGVPVLENQMHLLVPDHQLKNTQSALARAGYKEDSLPILPVQPGVSCDPNLRWEELGIFFRFSSNSFVFPGTTRPFPILIQGYSAAGATFHIPTAGEPNQVGQEDPRTFQKVNGLSIPPQPVLARSFLRADFTLRARYAELARTQPARAVPRTLKQLDVWVNHMKFDGYHPLGPFGMRVGNNQGGALLAGVNPQMASFWENGY